MDENLFSKAITEAAQKELDALLKQFESDFGKTIERITNLDIDVEGFSTTTGGNNKAGGDFRNDLAALLNQQFKRQKTPLERQVNRVGGRLFNSIFSNLFGSEGRTSDFNPSANNPMRLSQSQSAADIFTLLNSSGRNG